MIDWIRDIRKARKNRKVERNKEPEKHWRYRDDGVTKYYVDDE